MPRLILIVLAVALSACAEFPDLEETVGPEVLQQPYPALSPQGDLLTQARRSRVADEEEVREDLATRSGSLGSRADQIRNAPRF